MLESLEQLKQVQLPQGMVREIHSWFRRIIDDFERQPDSYYESDQYVFKCDVGVGCLKSLPVGGAWFVQVRRIGLRVFSLENFRDFPRLLACLIFYTRGVAPFCVIHTYPRYILRFNCRNMAHAYTHIGQLLGLNPRIKGIYRRSWFLDPELEKISPEMAYLRTAPEQNGAFFFRVKPIPADVRHALALSTHRRAMYEAGEYQPAVWAYIWPRQSFLDWVGNEG